MTVIELKILKKIDSFLKSTDEIKMPQVIVFFERLKKQYPEHCHYINLRNQQVNERFVNGFFVPHHSLNSIFKELNGLGSKTKITLEVDNKKKKGRKKNIIVQPKAKVAKSQRYEKENKRVREKFERIKILNSQGGDGTSKHNSIWPV